MHGWQALRLRLVGSVLVTGPSLAMATVTTGLSQDNGDENAEIGEYPVTVNAGTCNQIGEVKYVVGTAEPNPPTWR